MTDTKKTEALGKALQDFKNAVQVARSVYRGKVREIIKKSDEKKAKAIKRTI